MTSEPIRLGVVGLGRAFMLMLPTFRADQRIELVAAAAPREASRQAFENEFGGRAYETIEELCADPVVEAIYVATPHQMHRDHVIAAARAGKHVLVDKPLAISLEDGAAMVKACRDAGVHLIVGPSHSFDGPVVQAKRLIDEGAIGGVRMINAWNFTDFLYRPRRPEELDTSQGGGVVFSQGVHQIDIVRLLAGGRGRSVTAMTGKWDARRPTEGAYSALMTFEGGAFAAFTYSGYAHFDSDEWMDWTGELGHRKDPAQYGGARRALAKVASAQEEAALKTARTFGTGSEPPVADHHEHFGPIIICGDRGDLRLTPQGVHVYGDEERTFHSAAPVAVPRAEVADALFDAVRGDRPPAQTGAWGLASLEVCHAILQSAETGLPVDLRHQVSVTGEEGRDDRP
ncbi:gfo/Idh/MocA family oxidoreductase [Georhizobium profundi]|uniref:Gfo/Idh/MocA family oxidoreductase n=1 Tax=Georhizobium profundi TaxID=2341112 RepID=A0A3Q8XSW5_9HYPH|nr:Gfo/Idh/MocA family oxidoreductase [Georhizobium profundi]AZN73307.1 gfo/Idh/MocA family oxidoreductase [Georhizobium profundi]